MLSTLELRHIIETAFLPTKCICSVRAGSLMIQLVDPTTQQELLTVAGVDPKALGSSRAIARLVAEIKEELRLRGDAGVAALDEPIQA